MAKDAGNITIDLTNDFEDRQTVEQVIQIITGRGRFADTYSKRSLFLYRKVYLFAQKWDCPQIIYMLELYLSHLMASDVDSLDEVFIIAALMDNAVLCARTVRLYDRGTWAEDDRGELGHRPDCQFMDPSTWALEDFMICPPLYVWVLQRVMDTETKREARADKFLELIAEYRCKATSLRPGIFTDRTALTATKLSKGSQ
jgi:hypothetical protein